jgi:hypothetical protein
LRHRLPVVNSGMVSPAVEASSKEIGIRYG